jgi:hypothetical protein
VCNRSEGFLLGGGVPAENAKVYVGGAQIRSQIHSRNAHESLNTRVVEMMGNRIAYSFFYDPGNLFLSSGRHLNIYYLLYLIQRVLAISTIS